MKSIMENWNLYLKQTINEKTRYEKETGKRFDPTVDFKQKVTEHPTQYAFTMTAVKKVGINPRTSYDTPAGVYFYPLDQQRYDELINNKLPFASNQPYCGLVKLNFQDKSKWLIIQASGDNQPTAAIQKTLDFLKKSIPSEKVNEIYLQAQKEGRNWANVNTDGKIFIITHFASNFLEENGSGKKTTIWTKMLLGLGYIGAYDTGQSVIHPIEPTQLFCLLPSAYQLINIYDTNELRKGMAVVNAAEFTKKIKDLLSLPPEQRYYEEPLIFKGGRIPAGIKFKEITVLKGSQVSIPEGLVVEEDLTLEGAKVVNFGKNVVIGGSLRMTACEIRQIPQITVKGSIYANFIKTNFTIAEGIKVGQNIKLMDSNIVSLPNNLKVPGSLELQNCKSLKNLPQNLVVGDYLELAGTEIKELPDGLVAFGGVTVQDIRQMKVGKISVGFIYSEHDRQAKNYKKLGQGTFFVRRSKYFPDEKELKEIIKEELIKVLQEEWSEKYKKSINCKNPKGFSQRAHCQSRKK